LREPFGGAARHRSEAGRRRPVATPLPPSVRGGMARCPTSSRVRTLPPPSPRP